MTEEAHIQRGWCCGNACRHCPYGHFNVPPQYRAARGDLSKPPIWFDEAEEDSASSSRPPPKQNLALRPTILRSRENHRHLRQRRKGIDENRRDPRSSPSKPMVSTHRGGKGVFQGGGGAGLQWSPGSKAHEEAAPAAIDSSPGGDAIVDVLFWSGGLKSRLALEAVQASQRKTSKVGSEGSDVLDAREVDLEELFGGDDESDNESDEEGESAVFISGDLSSGVERGSIARKGSRRELVLLTTYHCDSGVLLDLDVFPSEEENDGMHLWDVIDQARDLGIDLMAVPFDSGHIRGGASTSLATERRGGAGGYTSSPAASAHFDRQKIAARLGITLDSSIVDNVASESTQSEMCASPIDGADSAPPRAAPYEEAVSSALNQIAREYLFSQQTSNRDQRGDIVDTSGVQTGSSSGKLPGNGRASTGQSGELVLRLMFGEREKSEQKAALFEGRMAKGGWGDTTTEVAVVESAFPLVR